jgi:zinc/manganese transport system substrate-binding protein
MIPTRRSLLGFATLAALPSTAWGQARTIPVVASFSILADLVRQVGGDRVEVAPLVGPEGDAHAYQPSPADARRLADARLLVVNGLGFERWLDRLVKASGTKAKVVVASEGLKPISAALEDGHSHPGHSRDVDPHAWQNVANVRTYVANICDALIAVDPDGKEGYGERAARYTGELDRLDAEIRQVVASIPPGRREIVTTHDAFAYFAAAYGLRFTAAQGVSTENEPTARDAARIIRQVRAGRIPAVFVETLSDPRLMEGIARESGARIGGKLYSDSLSGPGGPAATYLDMMRSNARTLAAALRTES